MIWKRIDKSKTTQPAKGNYKDWKDILRKEGYYQCVYCAIKESRFGGFRNFHVEHYRPKSIFKELINDIKNLFYACAICNTFKGDDWPAEPQKRFTKPFYPSPSLVDYNILFNWNQKNNILEGKNVTAKYLIEKLFLNRPQLITERRFAVIKIKLDYLTTNFNRFMPSLKKQADQKNSEAINLMADFVKILNSLIQLQNQLINTIPYEKQDITR